MSIVEPLQCVYMKFPSASFVHLERNIAQLPSTRRAHALGPVVLDHVAAGLRLRLVGLARGRRLHRRWRPHHRPGTVRSKALADPAPILTWRPSLRGPLACVISSWPEELRPCKPGAHRSGRLACHARHSRAGPAGVAARICGCRKPKSALRPGPALGVRKLSHLPAAAGACGARVDRTAEPYSLNEPGLASCGPDGSHRRLANL